MTSKKLKSPDLNNVTQCWPAYWSYSSMTSAWSQSHVQIITKTYTYTSTISSGLPSSSLNGTFSTLCDGLPRFDSEAEATNATILLPTPVTTVETYLSADWIWPTGTFSPAPSCSIRNADECSAAWSLFGSSLSNSNDAWTSSNILTVSLASPPASIVVNSETTPLTAPAGAFPTLTLHGESYAAERGTYTISGGTNLYGEVTLTPGGQNVLTWNLDQVLKPFGPTGANCSRPTGAVIQSQCATARCTIRAYTVQLLYFAPPSTSRDLCANTSPGFDSYSVSIYSHPHSSTVINSTTYWSDKAYVRYPAVSAYKWCALDNMLGQTSVPVGGTYSDHMVEVSSSDISSICDWRFGTTRPYGQVIGATAKPLNWEDLVGDIPASAYQCMPRCQSGCQSIVTDWYVPAIAVPPQLRARDPEWASCVPVFDGTPDPPIALGTAPGFLASTTTEGKSKTDPPTPGQTIPPVPVPTSKSIPQPPITTRFTQTITVPTPPPIDPQPSHNPPNPNLSNNPGQPNQPNQSNPPNNPNPNPTPITNAPTRPTAIATIGNSVVNADPSRPGTVIIVNPTAPGAAQTITPGGTPVIVSGTTISVNPTSGAVVITGDTTLTPVGTVGGKPVFVDPTRPGIIVIGDPRTGQPTEMLSVNGPSVVIDGTTISLAPAATALPSPSSTTVSGILISRLADGTVIINNSLSLRPGDPQITVGGHTIVLDPNGAVFVDGQRIQIRPTSADPSSTMVSGISLTLLSNGTLLVNGTIALQPGDPQISIEGHSIFIDPSGVVFVNGQQMRLSPASTTQVGELVIVGPDGTTTTLLMPSATGTTDDVVNALAAAINDAFASTTSSGSHVAASSQSASELFASVTKKVGPTGGPDTEAAPRTSSTKSGTRKLARSWSLLGVGIWISMLATLWV